MSRKTPTCKKCGKTHFGFVGCDELDWFAERQANAAAKREEREREFQNRSRVTVIRKPLPDGERVWGDRFETLQRVGGNRFIRVREEE